VIKFEETVMVFEEMVIKKAGTV